LANLQHMVESGEIVSNKSLLAFDEDVICKVCGAIFTLAESNWEGRHPTYRKVSVHGMQCPKCGNINVTYVRTPRLVKMGQRINKAEFKQRKKLRSKYQREFIRVQKRFGNA